MLINRVSVLLLLTGHGALGSLAGARIRLGPLTANRQTAAVTQALIASDLDLAANIGGHLTTEVTLNLECALDVVTQLDELCVAQVLHTGIRADSRFGQGLARTGAAHTIDVSQGDFHALFTWNVDSGKSCHGYCLLLLSRRCGCKPVPGLPRSPAPDRRYRPASVSRKLSLLRRADADGEVCAGVVLLKLLGGAPICSKSCSTLALLVARVGADDDDPAVTAGDLATLADLLDAGLNLHRFSFFRSLPR